MTQEQKRKHQDIHSIQYIHRIFKLFYDFSFVDDLDISPDFFEYFNATYSLLTADPTLWCVSAWNDNGKMGLISDDAGKISLHLTEIYFIHSLQRFV